jgi:hypothetical protein
LRVATPGKSSAVLVEDLLRAARTVIATVPQGRVIHVAVSTEDRLVDFAAAVQDPVDSVKVHARMINAAGPRVGNVHRHVRAGMAKAIRGHAKDHRAHSEAIAFAKGRAAMTMKDHRRVMGESAGHATIPVQGRQDHLEEVVPVPEDFAKGPVAMIVNGLRAHAGREMATSSQDLQDHFVGVVRNQVVSGKALVPIAIGMASVHLHVREEKVMKIQKNVSAEGHQRRFARDRAAMIAIAKTIITSRIPLQKLTRIRQSQTKIAVAKKRSLPERVQSPRVKEEPENAKNVSPLSNRKLRITGSSNAMAPTNQLLKAKV